MEDELQMAAELQKTFFPTAYPEFAQGAVEFAHLYHASETVGGDFCSIRRLSETEVGIFLCDVMGHGVRAALGTAIIRAIVEEISDQEKNPGVFLTRMNRALMPILRQGEQFLFATACYMILDSVTGRVRYSVAGHPSPILFNKHQADWLMDSDEMAGPALAIDAESEYSTRDRVLAPGDAIFMYTDGIYEEENAAGEEFGQERLLAAVRKNCDGDLKDLYKNLLRASCTFSGCDTPEDDACFVGFRLNQYLSR